MTVEGLYWVEFCPSVKLQNDSADKETSIHPPSKGVCRELVKYQLWVNCPFNMHATLLLSPGCSDASAGGMLHSEQQRHLVVEAATAVHHHGGGIHPGAGRRERRTVQGRWTVFRSFP